MTPRLLMVLALVFGACDVEPVGRLCDLGSASEGPEVVIASPALDCVSRTCLRVPLTQELPAGSSFPSSGTGLCTATCESDDDCVGDPGSPCVGGFECRVAVAVGPFCCQKLCACRDYGSPPDPAACDPDNPFNRCENLPGR